MNIKPLHKPFLLMVPLWTMLPLGCASSPDPGPTVQVVTAPPPMMDKDKPLPDQTNSPALQPGFDDPAILHQQLPEAPAFVEAYNRVNRPRIMVFVNRTITGDLIPVNPNGPVVSVQNTQQASGSVKASANASGYDYYSGYTNSSRSFESNGPGSYTNKTEIYLQPGQYDEAQAKGIDYQLIENLITDNLSSDGKITLISPTSARTRMTDQDVQELQSGRPQMLGEVAEKLQAEVLVQVTAHPSVQTEQGLGIRLIAEAFNTRGGQSIASAAVDVPPPLVKTTLNRFTRFVTRKLMDGMTQSWNTMAQQAPAVAPAASISITPMTPMTPAPRPAVSPTTIPTTKYDGLD